MGWLYTEGATKEDVVEEIVSRYRKERSGRKEGEIFSVEHSRRGNCLWMLCEVEKKFKGTQRFIVLFLLDTARGASGYKDLDETMGPFYYNCPVSFIRRATDPLNESSANWREKVLGIAEAKKKEAKARKSFVDALTEGDAVELQDDFNLTGFTFVRKYNTRSLVLYHTNTATEYKVKVEYLKIPGIH